MSSFVDMSAEVTAITPEVLVVGAGPTGLVTALCLLRNGISVRLIEKECKYRVGQRGAGIMPRSLELFSLLGVVDDVLKRAIPPPLVRLYELPEGKNLLQTFEMSPHLDPSPSCPYPNVVMLGQDNLEDILRTALAECGVRVELGTELVSFEQYPTHVVATLRKNTESQEQYLEEEVVGFSWILGADGAKGSMRKLLGFSFVGETRNVDNMIVGDIFIKGLDTHYWHMWGDAHTSMLSLRATETPHLFNFLLAGENINHGMLSQNEPLLRQCIFECSGKRTDIKFGDIPWLSHYRPNIRMVNRLGEGRVFIAGDAAHVHSPMGGQGLNTGIQDAVNLVWKVALIQKGLAPYSILETYNEERLPVIAELLTQTTALLNQTFRGKKGDNSGWLKGGSMLQLGVNYRWSSLVVDEQRLTWDYTDESDDLDTTYEFDGSWSPDDQQVQQQLYRPTRDGQLRAGDRAPDAPDLANLKVADPTMVQTVSLFDIFSVVCHTVLIFVWSADQRFKAPIKMARKCPHGTVRIVIIVMEGVSLPAPVRGAHYVLDDEEHHAFDAYALGSGCDVAIVRPDGFIGAIVRGAEGIQKYFAGIFPKSFPS
ncbi:hypothetical protein FISHEDRAFT_69455 [Fistulina hepatica ATCC 64428]|uniref:FAD-binding domain-containing protein n=1 Tax=Fistulina hepatica ATCC 64428 TaxID=1128425 RepID=A0A0D7AQC1_9AGAR|nr:hypothetical protein FISHEDRAFT_69455 [Fistulina hepatica ATCC 64428]